MVLVMPHLRTRLITDSYPFFRMVVLCPPLFIVSGVILLTGCGVSIGITEKAPATDVPAAQPANSGPAPHGVIESVAIKRNLVTGDPEPNLTREFIAGARQAGLFSDLSTSRESRDPMRDIGITLSVNETLDAHRDENQMRKERIERSFLLPVITPFYILYHKFEGDFESHMVLDVERWDGEMRHYTARARGQMEYPYNSDPEPSQQELIRQVTTNVLQSLVNQMARDRSFFVPPPGSNEVNAK